MSISIRMGRVRFITIAVALGGLSACADINHLREAQNTFNETARQENEQRTNIQASASDSTIGTGSFSTITSGYSAVVISIDKLKFDKSGVKKLREDGLYGSALMLQALAYWRLKNYDKALNTAKQASGEQLPPGSRDAATAKALPGLIANDQAYARLQTLKPMAARNSFTAPAKGDAESAVSLLRAVESPLKEADGSLPADHPMRQYLALSGLIARGSLLEACGYYAKITSPQAVTNATDRCYDQDGGECRAVAYANRLVNELKITPDKFLLDLNKAKLGLAMDAESLKTKQDACDKK